MGHEVPDQQATWSPEPGYHIGHLLLGMVMVQRGRFDEAAAAHETVLELLPGNSERAPDVCVVRVTVECPVVRLDSRAMIILNPVDQRERHLSLRQIGIELERAVNESLGPVETRLCRLKEPVDPYFDLGEPGYRRCVVGIELKRALEMCLRSQ